MGIGAISAAQPYVYNTNSLRVHSLQPIAGVNNDVSTSHIKHSGSSTYNQETVNPLSYGESKNFADILEEQMLMGRKKAERIFGEESAYAE